MCIRRHHVLNHIGFLGGHATLALAATVLLAVVAEQGALDVIFTCEQDDGLFFGDQLFVAKFTQLVVDDFGAAFIAVLFLHFEQLGLDNGQNFVLVRQNRLQPGNQCQQLVQLIFDSLALQPSQAAQLHSQDRLGLDLAQTKLSPQVCFSLLLRLRGADCFNHLINMVKGDLVAF